ncbi:MAG TPA: A24 family peptidase C-terminal domain-containing protein [Nitrososphaera sp.]|nr:A24 family peptidase C-terminal domain-containing protein [Nitrososphaera sp.]
MIAGIDFELIRILLAAIMLGTASILDIRKREVSDFLWVFFGAIAFTVYGLEFAFGLIPDIFDMAVPILIAAAISFGVYRSGLFGGADALALVTLAAILPTFNGEIGENLLGGSSTFLIHPIVPLIVLSNAVILSLSQIGFNLLNNAAFTLGNPGRLFEGLEHESISRKIIAVAIGYRANSRHAYSFPIEQTVDGRRQFTFALKNAETAEYESRENVWVTLGTPFLAFMLGGYITMLFVGDIAGKLLSFLLLLF